MDILKLGDDAISSRHYALFTDLTKTLSEEDLTILSMRERKIIIDENTSEVKVIFRIDIDFNILNTLDKIRGITNKTHLILTVNFLNSKQLTPCRALNYYIEDLKYSLIPFNGQLELDPVNDDMMYVYVTFAVKEKA